MQDARCSARRSRRPARGAQGSRRPRSSSRCSPALVAKEVLSVQADPRSPERGQYGFLQDLVRTVAYETLSREGAQAQAPRGGRVPRGRLGRTRRRSSRSSPRTTSTRTRPRRTPTTRRDQGEGARLLVPGGERAASLAAARRRSVLRAGGGPGRRPAARSRAARARGRWRREGGRQAAEAQLRGGVAAPRGRRRDACGGASAARSPRSNGQGRLEQALERMERAFVVSRGSPTPTSRARARSSAASCTSAGRRARSELLEEALALAERSSSPRSTRRRSAAMAIVLRRRTAREASPSHVDALDVALDNDQPAATPRLQQPRGDRGQRTAMRGELDKLTEDKHRARARVGDRVGVELLAVGSIEPLGLGGGTRRSSRGGAAVPDDDWARSPMPPVILVGLVRRGDRGTRRSHSLGSRRVEHREFDRFRLVAVGRRPPRRGADAERPGEAEREAFDARAGDGAATRRQAARSSRRWRRRLTLGELDAPTSCSQRSWDAVRARTHRSSARTRRARLAPRRRSRPEVESRIQEAPQSLFRELECRSGSP